jgi:tetratricopeptide (TPR) repeat protein
MVKLIRASTDRGVWSRPYEGSFEHMISLQQRIASDIAAEVGLPRLHAARRSPRTTNAQAYDAYLKGLSAKGMQRYEGFQRAAQYFEEAITLQPDFAEAYAELALTRVQFLYGGPVSPRDAITRAEQAAKEAIRLDDQLGQAHWALGRILNLYYWKFEEGGQSLKRASTLPGGRPNLADAALDPKEDFEEALAAAERGRDLDRGSVNAQVAVGGVYRRAGRYEEALREYSKAVEMSPQQPRLHFNLGITLIAMGRLDEAIRELEIAAKSSAVHNTRFEAYLGYAYAKAGRTKEARAILSDLDAHRREGYVSSFGFALIHDALQEPEPALAALQRAYEDHAVELAMINQYPAFKTIARDPRFQSIMKSVGLPQ